MPHLHRRPLKALPDGTAVPAGSWPPHPAPGGGPPAPVPPAAAAMMMHPVKGAVQLRRSLPHVAPWDPAVVRASAQMPGPGTYDPTPMARISFNAKLCPNPDAPGYGRFEPAPLAPRPNLGIQGKSRTTTLSGEPFVPAVIPH